MEADLRAVIAGNAGVSALVSTRVFPMRRPQGSALPAVTYQTVGSAPDYHLTGPSGLEAERVQVDCFGSTYASAKAVAAAVKAILSGYAGTQGATEFRVITIEGERDDFDADSENVGVVHRTMLDLMVHHRGAS